MAALKQSCAFPHVDGDGVTLAVLLCCPNSWCLSPGAGQCAFLFCSHWPWAVPVPGMSTGMTCPSVRFSFVGYLLFVLLSMLQIRVERDYSYTIINTDFSLTEFFLSLVFVHLIYFLCSSSFISQLIFISWSSLVVFLLVFCVTNSPELLFHFEFALIRVRIEPYIPNGWCKEQKVQRSSYIS